MKDDLKKARNSNQWAKWPVAKCLQTSSVSQKNKYFTKNNKYYPLNSVKLSKKKV